MVSRFFILGALIGVIGFLPEVLVSRGMKPGLAHLSSSLIYFSNLLGVIVIPLLSDRCGLRKIFIWPFSLFGALLIFSLGVFDGIASLVTCTLLGLVVGFIPIMMTIPMEMEGIGQRYLGTSLGLVWALGSFGGFIAPFVGGRIIDSSGRDDAAFIFWGLLMVIGAVFVLPMKETGGKVNGRCEGK
jgi:MFS family permease